MSFSRESFFYKEGQLCTSINGEVRSLETFLENQERPLYLYNKNTVVKRIEAYQEAFKGFSHHIHYAVKANPNLEILKLMKSHGLGADVVSIGEFRQALKAGFEASEIIFSGVINQSVLLRFKYESSNQKKKASFSVFGYMVSKLE